MNNLKDLTFTQRQLLHCATIDFPSDHVPLWDLINTVLVEVYTEDELRKMNQGVVSKVNSVINKIKQHWVVNTSPNLNVSEECNWKGEYYYYVSPLVSDHIKEYVYTVI